MCHLLRPDGNTNFKKSRHSKMWKLEIVFLQGGDDRGVGPGGAAWVNCCKDLGVRVCRRN